MRTHFSGALGEDEAEQAMCGTWFSEASNTTGDWARVDCRKCLARKPKFIKQIAEEEQAIVHQMGDMAEFLSKKEPRHDA